MAKAQRSPIPSSSGVPSTAVPPEGS
jgi:hypothetical protein